MRIFDSKPALRWLAPVALVLAVSGTGLLAATASADGSLPPTTAETLLAEVQTATVDGLSGTVVQHADLGIPAIPGAGGGDDTQLTSLISGDHTLRVAYSAPDKSRLAVLGTMGETDVFRNGPDLWTWSSNDNAATHRTLTADEQTTQSPSPQPTDLPKTPEEAAQRVLSALTPTTTVTTDSAVQVAGRNAYDLVLDPKDGASLIKQVRIAVDGETKVPLQVVVYGKDNQVAFKVGYTDVSFARPGDAEFVFRAPPGAKVTEATPASPAPSATESQQARQQADQAKADTKVVGNGWTSVVVTKVPSGAQSDQLKAFTDKLTAVSGTWGKGRLLAGTAFSAVLTEDGRLAVGAVSPDALYAALG